MRNKILIRCTIILFVLIIIPEYYMQISYEDSKTDKSIQETSKIAMQSCNCVAFRLDDIQGYWLNNAQITVMDEFQRRDIPLTIGIIGGEQFQFGVDPKITDYVKDRLSSKKDTIKIANHGWVHENFTAYDQKTQSDLLKKSNERISEILGIIPRTFIPPFNEFNDNTVLALQENQFTHFSPSLITGSYFLENSELYNFPETSSTGQIRDLGLFEGISHEQTFEEIKTGLDNFGFAVVMMHPQEFSIIKDGTYTNVVNDNQIKELGLLIDSIQDAGLQIVFLEEINDNVQSYNILIPGWFEKTLQWHSEGKMTQAEFSDTMDYLKRQGIVKFITSDYT